MNPARLVIARVPLAIRRIVGAALAVCFGFFSVECAVAEPEHGRDDVVGVASIATVANDTQTAPAPGGGVPSDDVHACHCVHNHGSLGMRPAGVAPVSETRQALRVVDVTVPDAVDLALHLRPPIA